MSLGQNSRENPKIVPSIIVEYAKLYRSRPVRCTRKSRENSSKKVIFPCTNDQRARIWRNRWPLTILDGK